MLVFFMLSAPFSVHARCKEPKRGPPGPPFIASFGTWSIPADAGIIVMPTEILPFMDAEISSGITNDLGVITFSRTGAYQLIFASASSGSGDILDVQLNGVLVAGGRMTSPPDTPQVITVMFNANAGDQLVVRNTGPNAIIVGQGGSGADAAYVSILQIQ